MMMMMMMMKKKKKTTLLHLSSASLFLTPLSPFSYLLPSPPLPPLLSFSFFFFSLPPPPPPPSPAFLLLLLQSWRARRGELADLLQEHILGRLPDTVPSLAGVDRVNETCAHGGAGACTTFYQLHFATPGRPASFYVQLITPGNASAAACTTAHRCPLFLTQWNHRLWALRATMRGYASLVYPGADTRDATAQFHAAYPNATWMLILRRAWLTSRALDFALTLPTIDPARVAITGHSRNGKQSFVAAAFDEVKK